MRVVICDFWPKYWVMFLNSSLVHLLVLVIHSHASYGPYLFCLLDQMIDRSQGNNAESEPKSRQHDEQRSLLLLLKPEIRKLCDVLLLPVCNMLSLC